MNIHVISESMNSRPSAFTAIFTHYRPFWALHFPGKIWVIPRDKLLVVDVDIVACVVDIVNDIEVVVIVLQVHVQLLCNMERLFHWMESFDAWFDCCIEMLLFDNFEHMYMEGWYQIDLQNNQAEK